MQRPLSLLFRAMGGASGVGVEAASARDMLVRRNLLQQVAGTCKQLPVAWCDASNLRLPQSLAVYPEVSLNQDLYRWLALLAAQAGRCAIGRGTTSAGPRPSSSSSRPCVRVTGAWSRLICSCADPSQLPRPRPHWNARCQALREPGSVSQFPRSERAPWPLPLWLYPADNLGEPPAQRAEEARAIWKPRPVASRASASGLGGSRKARARAACCCSVWKTCSAGPSISSWIAAATIPRIWTRPVSPRISTNWLCRVSACVRVAA